MNGSVTFSFVVPVGTPYGNYRFTATYNGNTSYAPSTSREVYDFVATPTEIQVTDTELFGSTLTVSATLTAVDGNCCLTGSASLYYGAALLQQTSANQDKVSFDVANLPSPIPAGTYPLTIKFQPSDTYYAPSTATTNLIVQ